LCGECIVATHEANALPVLLLKRLKLLKTPVVVVNVAMLQPSNLGKKKRIWKALLPHADFILSYCSAQLEWLREEFQLEEKRLGFAPLCVDTNFFTNGGEESESPFLLAVGTNEGKDYGTLIEALPNHIKLTVVTDQHNAGVIAKHTRPEQQIEVRFNVPIFELKKLYEQATFLVIPLHESKVSSGQTVLLENMALGKTVVVSDVSSIRDYVENHVSAVTVPAGNVAALSETIHDLWENPARSQEIGVGASNTVHQKFRSEIFAHNLVSIIERVVKR